MYYTIHYRRAHTESAKKWLSKLKEKENVPVLICLTFADQLYSEIAKQICGKETQKFPPRKEVEPKLRAEKEVLVQTCVGCYKKFSGLLYWVTERVLHALTLVIT